jgi:hypothetical protein
MSTTTPVQKSLANSIKLFSTFQSFGQNKLERLPLFIFSGGCIICDWCNESIQGSQLEWSTVFQEYKKKNLEGTNVLAYSSKAWVIEKKVYKIDILSEEFCRYAGLVSLEKLWKKSFFFSVSFFLIWQRLQLHPKGQGHRSQHFSFFATYELTG